MLFEAINTGPLTGFLEHGLQSNGCTVHVLGEALVDSLVARDRLWNDDGPSAGLPLEVWGGDVQRLTVLLPLIPAQVIGYRSQVNMYRHADRSNSNRPVQGNIYRHETSQLNSYCTDTGQINP